MSSKKGTLFGFFKKVESPQNIQAKKKLQEQENENISNLSEAGTPKSNFLEKESPTPRTEQKTPASTGRTKLGLGSPSDKTPTSKKKLFGTPGSASSKRKGLGKSGKQSSSKRSTKNAKSQKRKPLKSPKINDKPKPAKKARLEEEDDYEEEMPSSEEEDVDSGDEFVPHGARESEESDDSMVADESDEPMSAEEEEPESPVKKLKTPRPSRKLPSISTPSTPKVMDTAPRESTTWQHLSYQFLNEPKDAKRRTPADPDYDPSTLYVPDDFKQKLTPGMRQWWDLKSEHFDTILFFKVGKFYELYHVDAVIGVEQLGLTFMRGEWAHSGFPEIALPRNMEALIQKGYKCARIEQTETPAMMEERCKKAGRVTKFDKVVKREICEITSKGLQVCGSEITPGSSYLLALKKRERRIGVCLLDSTVGRFHIGEFEDDHQLSSIRTIVSRFSPVEAVLERSIERDVLMIVESIGCKVEKISTKNLPPPEQALSSIREKEYFKDKQYPEALKNIISEDDPLLSTPKVGCELVAGALAAVIRRLEEALIIDDVFTIGDFEDIQLKQENGQDASLPKVMILDSVALTNLEIFENSIGTTEGSLLSTINFTSTPFGLRQLKKWLLAPSCIADEIESRLDAVGELMQNSELLKMTKDSLRKLPDMDKMLARIHSLSLKKLNHPDSRAILYNNDVYSKRKIEDFCRVLDGFKDAISIVKRFHDSDINSEILKKLTFSDGEGGTFPDMRESLDFFDSAFNRKDALRMGKIIPKKGIDSEFDDAVRNVAEIQSALDDHLKSQMEHFGGKIAYVGNGRTAYQIEVPDNLCHKITSDHTIQGTKKGFKRYYTDEGKSLCSKMMLAEESRDAVSKDIMRRIFQNFDEKRSLWRKVIDCLSELDCLMSMALYGINAGGSVCRPQIRRDSSKPMIQIVNGSHPCLLKRMGQDKLIANDFSLGIVDGERCDGSSVALLTGPNMGGKSTLMKQVGLLTVMAQLGCWIPADSMEFTLVDRVFTRLGAVDHITLGESTFLVELLETALVFKHSTEHSLVLLDELGRGTSTNDGAAIAYAVLKDLAGSGRRTLFSTHYHDLAAEVKGVYLGHMDCVVGDNDDVVFLYKFVPGHCEKSFGFNVARLAGLDPKIIEEAQRMAEKFEEENRLWEKFFKYMSLDEF